MEAISGEQLRAGTSWQYPFTKKKLSRREVSALPRCSRHCRLEQDDLGVAGDVRLSVTAVERTSSFGLQSTDEVKIST